MAEFVIVGPKCQTRPTSKDKADGKESRCSYNHKTQLYYCAQRGFVCVDDQIWEDRMTKEQMGEAAENEVGQAEEHQKQQRQRQNQKSNGLVALSELLLGLVSS